MIRDRGGYLLPWVLFELEAGLRQSDGAHALLCTIHRVSKENSCVVSTHLVHRTIASCLGIPMRSKTLPCVIRH